MNYEDIVDFKEDGYETVSESSYKDYTKKYKDFDSFCKAMQSPEDVLNWYKVNNVNWGGIPNSEGRFIWPDEILQTKIGICFDHAVFMYLYCRKKNIPATMIRLACYKTPDYCCTGHGVTMFNMPMGWFIFDYSESDLNLKDKSHQFTMGHMFGPYKTDKECIQMYSYLFRNKMIAYVELKEKRDPKCLYNNGVPIIGILTKKELDEIYNLYQERSKLSRDEWLFSRCHPWIFPQDSWHELKYLKSTKVTKIPKISQSIFDKTKSFVGDTISKIKNILVSEETNPDDPEIKDVYYIQSLWHRQGIKSKVLVNACKNINGEVYRVRSEMLVFNKGKVFAQKRSDVNKLGYFYEIPGGSLEPLRTPGEQAAEEVKEEARILVKNTKYTGISYIRKYNYLPKWINELDPNIPYVGIVSYLYTGEYNGKYIGHVDPADQNKEMEKQSKFYNVDEIDWIPEHKKAINEYYSNKPLEDILDCKNPKELNELLNDFDYGIILLGKKYTGKDVDFNKYKTISPEDFVKYRCGTCWDYTEFESWYFDTKFNFKFVKNKPLSNGTYSIYYMQHQDKQNNMPTHTWLAYMEHDKVYLFESSWKSQKGIKEFKTELEMLNHYDILQREYYKNDHLTKGLIMKYKRVGSYKLDPISFMRYIYKIGIVMVSDFKEYPVTLEIQANQQHSFGFEEAKKVYESLSKEDKKLSEIKHYVDSSNIVTRELKFVGHKCVGFCDAYKHFGSDKVAFAIVVVNSKYRGKGIATELVNKVLESLKVKGYIKAIWKCSIHNTGSINTAKKCGFQKDGDNFNSIQLSKNLI